MEIVECRAEDLDVLERWRPTGLTKGHAARFGRQAQGTSSFLIAWLDKAPAGTAPAGSCEVRWNGCKAPEIQEQLGRCPEINGLQVWPEHLQSHGVGTSLVAAAEDLARRRGETQIGLGVDDDNVRAAALYLRLGYLETGCRYIDRWHYLDDAGHRHDEADSCRFLIKRLSE